MNKKTRALIGGVGVSAAVAAVALTGGTSAYFYDVETVTGNSIASCGIEIEPSTVVTTNGYNASSQIHATTTSGNVIGVTNMQPGDSFTADVTLKNAGSCAGDIWADINFPLDYQADDSFAQALQASVSIDGNPQGTFPFGELSYRYPDLIKAGVTAGHSTDLSVTVLFPESGVRGGENALEDKSLEFTIDYAVVQEGIDPTVGSTTGLSN